jgi:two-component system response regulator AlgR
MTVLRTLVVDDEPLAVERMQILCARLPDVQLVGTASDGEAALRLIEALAPDLIFLDIAMPGLSGLDVAEKLGAAALDGRGKAPAIVFVTAFDQFAIPAFDVAAIDYLLKPVAPERLEKAVARARERLSERAVAAAGAPEAPAARAPGPAFAQEFWVPNRGELTRVAVADIDWIEAERDYMRLHVGNRSWLIHETIGALEARLDPAQFLRLHRSAIVRRARIARLAHDGQGNWLAELEGGRQVRIGRTYLASVRASVRGG